jgi:hypothetical protein
MFGTLRDRRIVDPVLPGAGRSFRSWGRVRFNEVTSNQNVRGRTASRAERRDRRHSGSPQA